MSLETHLDSARERVRSERDAVQKKQTAYKRFITRVKNLSPGSIQSGSQVTALASGGTQLLDQSVQTETDCAAVRTAFRETIRPHSVDDLDDEEPLLQTIRAELSESLAIAVAPTTETRLTVDLQEAIVTEAQSQRVDLQAMEAALNRERDQLATAADTLTPIIEWLIDVNETPLLDVGFEGLADRHSTLESHRDSCEQLLLDRQTFLQETTSQAAHAGIVHRSLIQYLYQDFPIDYPALSTGIRLDELCAESQRAVRDHLVRRV